MERDLEPPEYGADVLPQGGRAIVRVRGEIDVAPAPAFAQTLREALAAGPVTLDLSALAFMDSSGIRVLDAVLRDPAAEGTRLLVGSDLPANVRQILRMTGLLAALEAAGRLTDPPPPAEETA